MIIYLFEAMLEHLYDLERFILKRLNFIFLFKIIKAIILENDLNRPFQLVGHKNRA